MAVVVVYILCLWWGGLCAVGLYGFLRIQGFLIIGSFLLQEFFLDGMVVTGRWS